MDVSHIINELGEERENYFNAVAPPIIQTSNFVFNTVNEMRNALRDEYSTYLYSRGKNPTVDILAKKLAALDGAEDCLVFNSGAAAIFAAVLANVKTGDHIISVKEPYTWANKMFTEILPKFGVTTTFIDGRDVNNFETARTATTTLIYLESPNSWSYNLQDLKAVADFAKQHNIITICDNSYCTPLYQQPIALGIDLSLQSATKYISGHSDTIAGVLSGSSKMLKRIFKSEYNNIGSGIQPFNAWLLLRGLRTLPLRLEKITASTHTIVNYLKTNNKVEEVIFPFDEAFPQLELAHQQMSGACGLFTIVLKEIDLPSIEKFCQILKHFKMAVSWGGHESLVIPRCAGIKIAAFNSQLKEHRMLRFYVGLETPEYLINDLQLAFATIP